MYEDKIKELEQSGGIKISAEIRINCSFCGENTVTTTEQCENEEAILTKTKEENIRALLLKAKRLLLTSIELEASRRRC